MLTDFPHNLFVGDIDDAKGFKGTVINVLEVNDSIRNDGKRFRELIGPNEIYFPVFNDTIAEFDIVQLELLFRFVLRRIKLDKNILIHCGAGIERSPFAMAYVLFRLGDYSTLLTAYKAVGERVGRNVWNWVPNWWEKLGE
jgi:predicted protein tyrosine phosphatase